MSPKSLSIESDASNVAHRGRWKVFIVAFTAILMPMLLWTLASPLMSVPDEPSHAIRAAAVVRGEISSVPWSENTQLARADVPRYVAHAHELTCYAFDPTISAGCMRPVAGDPLKIVTTGHSAGTNSPAYYAIVGIPTLVLDGTPALYAMRGVNAVLTAATLALMIMQLTLLRRSRWALVATYIAVTPMVIYLGGAINPNGLEIAAAGALLVTLTATFRIPSSRAGLWERAGFVVVSAALLLSTRSIAMLWVLLIIAAAFALGDKTIVRQLLRKPAAWTAVGLSALFAAGTAYWYLHPAGLSPQQFQGAGTSPRVAFVEMLSRTLDFADGYVGLFGWVDTPSPSFSVIAWSFAIVATIAAALVLGTARGRLTVLALALLMIFIPAITQVVLISSTGYIWQGRYMLALLLCLLVACGIVIDDSDRLPVLPLALKRALMGMLVLLAFGHVFSLLTTLRRYVVSVTGGLREMLLEPQWQPPLSWQALTALMAVAVGAAVWLTYRRAATPLPVGSLAAGTNIVETKAK
ncbi:DUF2142 domain-containing protein [Cryobacterium psychrophilum]|uniref:DUF2142 domain-containing protein n=1 Tax=Cryobacterium psychrophilum TaxID=41988 RepID=A0A4Y8KK19_9MICO|nr:DUF2142 domain-containing protein [Cryobacterium psychrophilum]TDW30696.1 putative membrane protein DUF2142 [Cryobacterium psychrophilum]TFD76620.1 DUF2142 domain-containing protein [Cryobacterium psychrophilum]